ncbi:MAG: hypothetical protein QW128_00940 [Thermoprotei archaeon]
MSHNTVGKIEFDADVTIYKTNGEVISMSTPLYVHFKGFQGARSTHLDLASSAIINSLKLRRGGMYALMSNDGDVIEIYVSKQDSNLIGISRLRVRSTLFINLQTTKSNEWIWIGVKEGNLIINLKKEHIRVIENTIKERYPLIMSELSYKY